jgi:uncharacterized protein (TIGR00255 family)
MKSMTGFGRASLESNGKNYIIEIKTVNNKYSDITVKSPKRLSFMEDKIRKQIANRITRGKVEVSVSFFDFSNKSKNVVLNKEIAKEYIKQLREIADENNLSENISVVEIAKLPDILNSIDSDNDEEIASEALQCLNMALDSLIEMRKAEGENIKQDLLVRIERVQNLVDKIAENSKGIVEEYVSKLEKRVKEILKTDVVDENRIAQEAVIYADKLERIMIPEARSESDRELMREDLETLRECEDEFAIGYYGTNGFVTKESDIEEFNKICLEIIESYQELCYSVKVTDIKWDFDSDDEN